MSRVAAPDAPRVPVAFVLAFVAVVTNLVDAWLFPAAGANTGGIKFAGYRVADLFAVAALLVSLARLLSGRVRVPPALALPLGLATWVFAEGVLVGTAAHHDGRVIFAECHVLLYLAAVPLAWVQTPAEVVARFERVLPPLALLTALTLVASSGVEKGGDPSTIVAGIAALALVRTRPLLSVPLAVSAAVLVAGGGQRAALLFSLPPLVVTALLPLRGRRPSADAAAGVALGVALLAGAAAALAGPVTSLLNHLVHSTFQRTAKAESADSRREQWAIALHDIHQAPWFGHGLGFQYQLYDPQLRKVALTDITHDVFLDVLLRFGIVGSAVLACALAVGVVQLVRLGRVLTRVQVVCLLVLTGLLVKGSVESVFDKPRLMLFAGWLVATLLVPTGGRRYRPPARAGAP